jgi:hypothetical protein
MLNLKLKRLVRTTSSEQYALFNLDQGDASSDALNTIGKMDLHYTAEGVYGTLLVWDDRIRDMDSELRGQFVYGLLDELSQPMGVPHEYVVEFFTPSLDQYEVFHNVGLLDVDDVEDADEEIALSDVTDLPVETDTESD